MTTANNANNNLSPWQPGQSGNPSGRPKGTRDLAGYVLETTDGGKELVDALVSIARGTMPLEPATTSDGVSEPFLIGCYINASLGSWAEGELIYANFRQ